MLAANTHPRTCTRRVVVESSGLHAAPLGLLQAGPAPHSWSTAGRATFFHEDTKPRVPQHHQPRWDEVHTITSSSRVPPRR